MFTKVRVKNFKSLIDFELNLEDKKNTPKNLAIIYGENGAGKTNIATIFFALINTFRTMDIHYLMQDVLSNEEFTLEEIDKEEFMRFLSTHIKDVESIIKTTRTIGSEENLVMEFEFFVNGKIGVYAMEFDKKKIVSEKLSYTVDKNKGVYFDLTTDNKKISSSVFIDASYKGEIEEKIEKFWGKHTILAILAHELSEQNTNYFNGKLNKNLFDVMNFFNCLSCRVKTNTSGRNASMKIDKKILSELMQGEVDNNLEELNIAEELLNEIFTALYADIKHVYYVIEDKGKKVRYRLFCKKLIGGNLIEVPFKLESTGTLAILELVPYLLMVAKGNTVVIDEFDTAIHDLLAREIIMSLLDSISGQLIITTHNTLLLEEDIDKKSLYFLVVNENGDKEIHCLNDYEHRTHPNHNVRSLYLKGLYDGIPVTRDLDFDSLVDIINSKRE